MQEAAAGRFVWPSRCSPLPDQPDISGLCVWPQPKRPDCVSDGGSVRSVASKDTTHCMKQSVDNKSRTPRFSSAFWCDSLTFYFRYFLSVYCIASAQFCLVGLFSRLMVFVKTKQKKAQHSHLLSMVRPLWWFAISSWHTRPLWLLHNVCLTFLLKYKYLASWQNKDCISR